MKQVSRSRTAKRLGDQWKAILSDKLRDLLISIERRIGRKVEAGIFKEPACFKLVQTDSQYLRRTGYHHGAKVLQCRCMHRKEFQFAVRAGQKELCRFRSADSADR